MPMNEINIIYTWKNKEVKTKLIDDEKLLLIEAIHAKAMELFSNPKFGLLEKKIIYGLLGSNYRHITNIDDVEELKQILKIGVDLNFNFQVDITLD